MANEDLQWIKKGMTYSVRNLRVIDRTMLHGARTMRSVSAAVRMFEGMSPDVYQVSGFLTTFRGVTNYFDPAFALVARPDNASGSILLYENGALHKGPVPSGTVLLDPRTFFDPRSGSVEPTITVSGEITITISSGEIKNFVF